MYAYVEVSMRASLNSHLIATLNAMIVQSICVDQRKRRHRTALVTMCVGMGVFRCIFIYVFVAKQYHNNKLQSALNELFVQLKVSGGERSFLVAEASSTNPPIQMQRTANLCIYVDAVVGPCV